MSVLVERATCTTLLHLFARQRSTIWIIKLDFIQNQESELRPRNLHHKSPIEGQEVKEIPTP